MDLNKYYDWENMAISSIIWLMIRWFNFDTVEMNVSHRTDVESSVWFSISIQKDEKRWHVDGQTPDIVRRRLIEYLDKQGIRDNYKKSQP